MWTLTNESLPQSTLANNPTVQGLELLELGTSQIRSPLFRSSVLSSLNQSEGAGSGNVAPGVVPVINTEPLVPLYSSFLYKIEGFLTFPTLTPVNSINLLEAEKYTYFQGITYVLTTNATLQTEIEYFTEVPNHDSNYTYKLNLGGFGILAVDKVEVEGLLATFNYDLASEELTLIASKSCKPKPGKIASIKTEKVIDLSLLSSNQVFVFDYATKGVTAVYYLDYLGQKFYLNSSLQEGTLFNNYSKKLAVAVGK